MKPDERLAPIRGVLPRLEHVQRAGENRWTARCPAHGDRNPSLSVAVGSSRQVLLTCHAGCGLAAIVGAIGLTEGDLFVSSGPAADDWTPRGPAIATYEYVDEGGHLLFGVCRTADKQFPQWRPDPAKRHGRAWNLNGIRRVLYRLPQVLEAVRAGKPIYIVEGEKDVHALEGAGIVATCNPGGAGKWRKQYAEHLQGAEIVVVADADEPGRKHAARVARSLEGVAAGVRILEPAEGKDVSDHLNAGRTLDELVAASTVSPDDPDNPDNPTQPQVDAEIRVQSDARTEPGQLAFEPDILSVLRQDLGRAGLAGEHRSAEIAYLCLTSRVLPWGSPTNRPVSAIGRGTSSSGKSYTVGMVLRFFPRSAFLDLGSMSRRYLLYTEESLEHRFVVIPEWALIAEDDELVAAMRSLLSEGHLVHGTVEGNGKKWKARRIEKPGPTGLLMTTTAAITDPELETRCVAYLTDDTPEQTRRVFAKLASLEDDDEGSVDFERWCELQEWIASHGEHRVVVPYIGALAELMPHGATRLRRDFVSVVCLVRAHAILHQCTRERDELGRVIANVDDYAVVRDLLDDLVAESVDASVSPATRETVEAVRDLLAEAFVQDHVSVKQITDRLKIGRSATYDRVRRALAAGFLTNVAKKDERGLRIALGADLPGDGSFLPEIEDVVRVSSGGGGGRDKAGSTSADAESSGSSGSSGRPTNKGAET